MAKMESFREMLSEPPDAALFEKRAREGWKLVALEWQRAAGEGALPRSARSEEVPYGLRVANDCHHLEEDPAELNALMLMMEQIVLDEPLSKVARALNDAGHRTRQGAAWDPVSVFNMMPRLIEVGPRMFSTEEWEVRRRRLFKVA
jgi:hypothetical protein